MYSRQDKIVNSVAISYTPSLLTFDKEIKMRNSNVENWQSSTNTKSYNNSLEKS